MSFRQKEESQYKQETFQLVYPGLIEGLNRTKEGYVIPTKEESQYKQEMFRLVYPGLVEGLNMTCEGYVMLTEGSISM